MKKVTVTLHMQNSAPKQGISTTFTFCFHLSSSQRGKSGPPLHGKKRDWISKAANPCKSERRQQHWQQANGCEFLTEVPQLGERYEKCMAPLLACVSAISSLPSVLFPCLWQVAAVGNQGPEQPPGNLSLSQSNTEGQRATELGKMIMPPQMNIACWSVITQPENSPTAWKRKQTHGVIEPCMMWSKYLQDLPHNDCPVK